MLFEFRTRPRKGDRILHADDGFVLAEWLTALNFHSFELPVAPQKVLSALGDFLLVSFARFFCPIAEGTHEYVSSH